MIDLDKLKSRYEALGIKYKENNNESLSKLTQDLVLELEDKKEALIKLRLKERANIEIDFIEESFRTFPRISRTFQCTDQSEHWYWNDGSKDGLHLISFLQDIVLD